MDDRLQLLVHRPSPIPKIYEHTRTQQDKLSTFHKRRNRGEKPLQNEPLNLKLLNEEVIQCLSTFILHHDFLVLLSCQFGEINAPSLFGCMCINRSREHRLQENKQGMQEMEQGRKRLEERRVPMSPSLLAASTSKLEAGKSVFPQR